jgi:hypothetical protein
MEQSADTASPTPTGEPTSSQVSVAQKQKGPKKSILLFIFVIALIAVAGIGGYILADSKAKKETGTLKSQITALESNVHELPADAIKVSECIPNMGAHYLPKDSDPQYGPFLLVNKANKVIGVEFMASQDMYTAIPGTEPPVSVLTKNSPLYGWKFDHLELSHTPEGHPGFLEDHIDAHLYTVTREEQKQACI